MGRSALAFLVETVELAERHERHERDPEPDTCDDWREVAGMACQSILSRSGVQAELEILRKPLARRGMGEPRRGIGVSLDEESQGRHRSRRVSSGTTIARRPFLWLRIGGEGIGHRWARVRRHPPPSPETTDGARSPAGILQVSMPLAFVSFGLNVERRPIFATMCRDLGGL
jgi:hypothetical protein